MYFQAAEQKGFDHVKEGIVQRIHADNLQPAGRGQDDYIRIAEYQIGNFMDHNALSYSNSIIVRFGFDIHP